MNNTHTKPPPDVSSSATSQRPYSAERGGAPYESPRIHVSTTTAATPPNSHHMAPPPRVLPPARPQGVAPPNKVITPVCGYQYQILISFLEDSLVLLKIGSLNVSN